MRVFSFASFTKFIPPAGNLTVKDQLIPVIASFFCIAAVTISSNHLSSVFQSILPSLILLSSMGSSVVILLLVPHSPLAQPWSFFAGHLVSALVGVICALYVTPFWAASALAVSGSIFAMLCLRCLHPPCAGTTLVPVIGGAPFISLGYEFLIPVLCNVLIMLMMVMIVNRWLLKLDYPQSFKVVTPSNEDSLSQQDVEHAIKAGGEFVDVSVSQLHELLLTAEQEKLKRLHGHITCADIMVKDIVTVEYGDEVETTWQIMHREKLKTMPVVDKANRVIGIVTRADFFKFVELSPYSSFQDTFRTFIRRTSEVTTTKPEVIGHIMTKQVVMLPESASATDLIILFSTQGHQQIPIINAEKRLVGVVYQANLITALSQLMQRGVTLS